MTRAHYYASSVRNIKDVANYALYPLAKLAGYYLFRDEIKATALASTVTAGFYAGLTTSFFGQEARMFEIVSQQAVAAELGVNPKDLQFSDYWRSKNAMVQQECRDIERLTKVRYMSDALFLAPIAVAFGRNAIPGFVKKPHEEFKGFTKLSDVFGVNDMAMSVGFAGKAAYWWEETYNVKKTGLYEFV